MTLPLATGALAVFAFMVNLPFGWWRAGLRKLSPAWFVAVHAAVPLVIGARLALGLPFRWLFVPLYAAAYFSGQALGARLRARAAQRS
jgi:hypothetical protein